MAIALGDNLEDDVDDATIDKIAARTRSKVPADGAVRPLLVRRLAAKLGTSAS